VAAPGDLRGPARAFGELLARVGYGGLGERAAAHLSDPALRRAASLAALDPADPCAALQRLFLLSEPGPLPPEADVGALEALELVRRDGDGVVPLVRIDELDGLFVCSDLAQDRPDAVPPVSASTRMVAAFTPDVAADAALDVGTGSGALALLLARRAGRVVATDLSERALAFTRRNAELNGLDNVETRNGSFLEPVRGERFGVVVCNPPYVISPDTEFLYRDAGLRGDELCRQLLDELPDVLTGDGYATLQGNWTHAADGPWHPRPRATALLTRIKTYAPLEYAQSWCGAAHAGDPEGFTAAVERWTASYRELGIEAITLAIVVLRGGRPLRPWATTLRDRPAGLRRRLPALFAAAATLARADVLDLRLRPAPGLTVQRRRTPGGEERCLLEHPATPCVRRGVSSAVANAVEALPGPPDFTLWDELSALVKLGFVELA
jgi:methylase of polypeptide subunit release factors